MVEIGDVIGLFAHLSNDNPVIEFDTYSCSHIPTLLAATGGVTSPLTFYADSVCHHYSMKTRFVGYFQTKRNQLKVNHVFDVHDVKHPLAHRVLFSLLIQSPVPCPEAHHCTHVYTGG